MRCADRDRIREAKSREITLQILVFRVIDLIDDEDDRRFRFAQDPREFLIDRRQSGLGRPPQTGSRRFRAWRHPLRSGLGRSTPFRPRRRFLPYPKR